MLAHTCHLTQAYPCTVGALVNRFLDYRFLLTIGRVLDNFCTASGANRANRVQQKQIIQGPPCTARYSSSMECEGRLRANRMHLLGISPLVVFVPHSSSELAFSCTLCALSSQCVGQRYAMNHLMLFLCCFVSTVKWTRVRTRDCDDIAYVPTIVPKDGGRITVEPASA